MVLQKKILLQYVMEAIKKSDWKIISSDFPTHPLSISASQRETSKNMLVYVWNITHGGRTRSLDEYRIQITGVKRLKFIANTQTLLLGMYIYDQQIVFIAFDPTKHHTFGFSPSIQVKKQTIDSALIKGLAFQEKILDSKTKKMETIIAFVPQLFMDAILDVFPNYHDKIISEREIKILKQKKPISEEDLKKELIPVERKKAIRTVASLVRKTRFRDAVMSVYNSKCAICKVQLDLPEACHILPVKVGGVDTIDNGIALCPTHHKAFDNGLIDIDDSYDIKINENRLKQLSEQSLSEGKEDFLKNIRLGEKIALPKKSQYAPKLEYLQKSRLFRGFL